MEICTCIQESAGYGKGMVIMMKNYLSLILISAKVHKRQNRMTLFCIFIAVFLVTTVFGMADMAVKMEKIRAIENHGNWHIMLQNTEENIAAEISARKDVAAVMWYQQMNDLEEPISVNGKNILLCGADLSAASIIGGITEGHFPENSQEIVLTENGKTTYGISVGDRISVELPSGSSSYLVSGFTGFGVLNAMQYDALVILMNREAFEEVCRREKITDREPVYYVQFKGMENYRKSAAEIKEQYHLTEEQMAENTALMGVTGFSENPYMLGLYLVAAVLAVFILAAGVFMIAGSLNSNVAERTQFFGMLRCIGAGREQIIRLVRMEALNWCKMAIPTGILSGIAVTWILCFILRTYVSSEFEPLPVFGVSVIGIVCGGVIGILTVLLAARAPAKRAASVSPLTAVSGNAASAGGIGSGRAPGFWKIETALGVYHAISAKKNLALMTGSFALSMILFLSFSVVLNWVHFALNPLKPYAPDCEITSRDRSCSIDASLPEKIREMSCVKRVFSWKYCNLPAEYEGKMGSIDLIPYEESMFLMLKKNLTAGDMGPVMESGGSVLVVYDKSNRLTVGDIIKLTDESGVPTGEALEVAGILSESPFATDETPTVICSEETFTALTGLLEYSSVYIQFTKDVTDEDVNKIRALAGEEYLFSDRRAGNQNAVNTYRGFSLFVYGFLAIISLITVLNIVNSISMSVSAKIRQYGATRAVGMDVRGLTKMIAVETITYVIIGFFIGCIVGLPLHRFLYMKMITKYFGDGWHIPFSSLAVILLLMLLSSIVAVYKPAKRIRNMVVTDVINEL